MFRSNQIRSAHLKYYSIVTLLPQLVQLYGGRAIDVLIERCGQEQGEAEVHWWWWWG